MQIRSRESMVKKVLFVWNKSFNPYISKHRPLLEWQDSFSVKANIKQIIPFVLEANSWNKTMADYHFDTHFKSI